MNRLRTTRARPPATAWAGLHFACGLTVGPASAAPIEGETASNAAVILVLLGVWALVMGIRNLRDLRYKRHVPDRRSESEHPEELEKDL